MRPGRGAVCINVGDGVVLSPMPCPVGELTFCWDGFPCLVNWRQRWLMLIVVVVSSVDGAVRQQTTTGHWV